MADYQQYFEFIRYAIDAEKSSIPCLDSEEWKGLFQFAKEQTIVGVVFEGVKKMSDGRGKMEESHQPLTNEHKLKPPFNLLMEWIGLTERIAKQNKILNRRCVEVVREYQDAGFQCCVLKGQGNAVMYDGRRMMDDGRGDSLALLRTPGDIDLWVLPADGRGKADDVRRDITKYVKEKHPPKMEMRYYHIGYQDKGIEVEAHFMPNIMNNPVYHRRLQEWYRKMADDGRGMVDVELPDGVGRIPVPTAEFNIVFQLAHMMHHFFDEGIGLRQFVDYYFVLMAADFTDCADNKGFGETLRYLGLWNFAGAVMYVMREVFRLEERYMIAPVDELRGKTLMTEILKGGNFGRHSGLTKHSAGGKYFAKTWRNMQLVREYPAEALCEPLFRTWHFFWRQWRKFA